jgi:hypothetical protein
LIQDLDTRFRSWKSSSGGNRRAAVKVGVDDLDDVLLIPRQGETPFQAIPQFFLGGNTTGASPGTIFPIHAGSPSDTEEVGKRWVSSQEYSLLIQDRYQAFRKPGGPGTVKSSCFLGNFHGTPEDAEAIVESAAAAVLKAHKGCNKKASSNSPVLVHKRDLEVLKEMSDRGEVYNLGHQPNDFWTDQRKAAHEKKIVDGGGCERGRMVGTERDEHHQLCVDGGGSKRGCMVGTERDEHHQLCVDGGGSKRGRMEEMSTKKKEHVAKCEAKDGSKLGCMAEGSAKKKHVAKIVAKGGNPKGPMIGTVLVDHRAKLAEAYEKKNALLFRLANGKKDQEHEWTESCRKKGNATIYTFTNGNGGVQIEGKRDFEDYLVDSYESEDLTEDGNLALVEMKKKRDASVKRKAKYDRKKKRAN